MSYAKLFSELDGLVVKIGHFSGDFLTTNLTDS